MEKSNPTEGYPCSEILDILDPEDDWEAVERELFMSEFLEHNEGEVIMATVILSLGTLCLSLLVYLQTYL